MPAFENVRVQLLTAGIAAGYVNRYVVELREHLADLTARERGSGMAAGTVAAKVRTIMGTDAQLVQAMLDRAPPRALAVKAPWAVFGVLPVIAIIATGWIVAMAMMRLLMPVRATVPADLPASYQALLAAAAIFTGYIIGPLSAAACIAVALRQRLSSAWVWIGLALIALFSAVFAFHASTGQGDPYRAVALVSMRGHVNTAATLVLIALRAGVLFVLAALVYRALKARQANPA